MAQPYSEAFSDGEIRSACPAVYSRGTQPWFFLIRTLAWGGKFGLRVPLSTNRQSHGFSYKNACLRGGILVCVSRCSHICPKKNKTKFLPFYYTMQFAGFFFNCLLLLFWTFEYINITCTTLRESHLLPPFTRASLFSCLWVNYYNSLLFFLTPTRYPYPVPLRLHLEKKKQTFSYPVPLRSKKRQSSEIHFLYAQPYPVPLRIQFLYFVVFFGIV